MKGATAVPSVTTTKTLTNNKAIIIGTSQNFFLTNKNLINSFKKFML